MIKKFWHVACVFLIPLFLGACDSGQNADGPKYSTMPLREGLPVVRFAVHPLHNPQKLVESYQPLINLLNQQQNEVRFVLEASRDYTKYEEKLRNREPQFLLPNPWQTLVAIKAGYSVFAMAGTPEDFKGLILVRKDGDIHKIADLIGKAISYPSPTALAACMMPQMYLLQHGVNVVEQTQSRYVGSQESSIMNVYLKQTAAGATWPPPWRFFQKEHPEEAAQLRVAWETESMVNNSVMARNDVPPELVAMVRRTLLTLQETPEGRAILLGMETQAFLPASNQSYNVVAQFIQEFEKKLRKVEAAK